MHVGDLLGPYALRREIGEGGIAEVFIAEDAARKRGVVVKALRPELVAHPETLAIFLGEPRALQSVEHENTLEVLDVVAGGAQPYFVTELLRGRTLAEVLRQGKLPLARALHIARQVATVLAHAHDVEVVHRNLKPANVFLVKRDGQPDFVKLLELGAVRMQSAGEKPIPGTVIGTPAYMAPEQLKQIAGDTRVDMYSFGVLLYELTIGWKPFVGEVADIVRQHLLERAPRARAIAPDTPAVLDDLIAQCLEKKPDDRPPSMHEVSLSLAALADSLEPPVFEDQGAGTSVAVPKNTSGYTTVPADVTIAPAPVMSFDEDEPSFESVTGEWAAPRALRERVQREALAEAAATPKSAPAPVPDLEPSIEPSIEPSEPSVEPSEPSIEPSVEDTIEPGAVAAPPKRVPEAAPAPAPLFTFDEPAPMHAAPTAPAASRSRASLWAALVGVGVLALGALFLARREPPATVALADANVVAPVEPAPVEPAPVEPAPVEPAPVEPAPPAAIADAGIEVLDAGVTPSPTAQVDAGTTVRDSFPVFFSSTPAGAQVWIRMDRRIRLLCNTPCSFTLPAGKELLVELRLDGYRSAQRTLTVAEGARFDGRLRR